MMSTTDFIRKTVLRMLPLILCSSILIGCDMLREAQVDHLLAEYSGAVPGAEVMAIKNGNIIFKKAYGLANLETGERMRPEHNLRLASMTKQFTAMCILMLSEQRKLTYETTLKDIFPEFPEYGKNITIRHLLTHTSGLIAYEDLIPDTATVQVHDADVLQMMMQADSTYFVPGTKYRYSNSGYAVLAMIIEKISGKSFAQFLRENIFQPLAMNRTVAYEKGISTVPMRAYGYAVQDGHFVFRDQSLTSAVLGDGGIYSSVDDLYRWDQALYGNQLVARTTFAKAVTPDTLTDGNSAGYGFGWRIDTYRGHLRNHHTGGTCGFTTVIQRYPEDHFTVIILTNRDRPSVMSLGERLTDLFLFHK